MHAFIPMVLFVSIAWVIESTVNRRALNRERLKIIEKGGDLGDLNLKNNKGSFLDNNALKYGLVAVGAAIGTLIGSYFEQNEILANNMVGYIFSISLFVGLALILSHYLLRKEAKKNNEVD
ncbi:hypothetical protein EI546_12455 [Aequorivita sp. H23M31]|uniref:DUF6249 domain-containing protein n=1 Tax=Aequorivita ciconiae TaxID=2494375 RepID=A0A410G5H5_9FLAO|nr:DUF6249 domain-containing protein [Aequorivita sp. H23M31]QAA82481.1 hypothetical protein EI546_12455 [Aequorivita sp. H23M31]